jgi:F-type H+-transporting ATPase subunit a
MSRKQKIWLGVFIWLGVAVALYAIVGSDGKNDEFKPQDEFKLDPWISIHIGGLDLSFTKATLYLLLACILTCGTMIYIAKRMQDRPNRVQTLIEGAYDLTYTQIARGNMPSATAAKYFPFVATLFFFIWFSNMLGYIPLPVNSHETIDVFGIAFPAFALYAATANLSIPLVLTLSVRLFANILAGHLLILFMGGGLAVLLGLAALGWITLPIAIAFFILEVGLIATLQAFIFATLTSIYFGEASAGGH